MQADHSIQLCNLKNSNRSACRFARLDLVKWFVEECKIDVNARNEYGVTPIYMAVSYFGRLDIGEVAEYLISKGMTMKLLAYDL